MKLKMESKEIKNLEIGVHCESDSQHIENSMENTSTTSMNQSIPTVKIASFSKKEGDMKEELVFDNVSGINYNDCIKASASEFNSIDGQQHKTSSSVKENVPASKEGKAIKAEEDVCITEDSAVGSASDSIESQQNEIPLEVSHQVFNIEDDKNHRQIIHYSSESSDFETDESSDSEDDDEFFKTLHKNIMAPPTKIPVLKTKGELLFEDLPPVEELRISVEPTELQKIGSILHPVINQEQNEFLVIVKSDGISSALDTDSVLFLSSGEPLGKIYEVFGHVKEPYYTIRFNKEEDIYSKGFIPNDNVYISPEHDQFTRYVLVEELKQQKGSDASWKDNNEPPDDQIDYSDDEQEKLARQKRRAKNRKSERNCNSEEEDEHISPNKMEKRNDLNNQERAFVARPTRNKFRSPGPSKSPSHSFPFGSAPSLPGNFRPDLSGLQRNAASPESFGRTSSVLAFGSIPQGRVPSPQCFAPLPYSSASTSPSFGSFMQSRVPTPHSFASFSQSNVPSHQSFAMSPTSHAPGQRYFPPSFAMGAPQQNSSFMAAPQNNVPMQQQLLLQTQQPVTNLSQPPPNSPSFGSFMQSRVPTPHSFGTFSQSNVPSPQPFAMSPTSHAPGQRYFPPSFAMGAPQQNSSFMAAPQNNVPMQQQLLLQTQQPVNNFSQPLPNSPSFGSFMQNRMPTPHSFGTFSQSNVPSPQPFAMSQTSHAPAQHYFPPSFAMSAPQQNSSSFMAAPQNNVPMPQQLLLQTQQPVANLSQLPPNF